MSDFTLFLGKFLKQGTAIASLAPSSPWLSRATVRNIDWTAARVIVELGAGTGPITRVLAAKALPGCRVVVLERDPDFCRLLQERFAGPTGLDVVEGDVRDLAAILADRGIGQTDYIVSGLPVPSFPRDLQQAVYLRFYRKYFEDVQFVFEPRNLPPAGAYFCRRVKPIA